jgi:hypothetical protein
MFIKKALVTSSCFLVSAVLLSQVYSFAESRLAQPSIDTSAFSNLVSNIQSISSAPVSQAVVANEDTQITADIIKVIDKEISKNIKHTKYAMAFHKPKVVVAKVEVAKTFKAAEPVVDTVVETVAATKYSSEDLSNFEINNKSLVELYALNNESVEYSQFESITLASSYELKELKDEVAVKVASTENKEVAPIEADEVTTSQPAPAVNEKDDDMVMFEYSDKVAEPKMATQSIDDKLYNRPLSNTVKKAINRVIGDAPIKKLEPVSTPRIASNEYNSEKEIAKIDDQEIDLNDKENVIYDYTQDTKKKALAAAEDSEAFTAPAQTNTHETQFVIRAKELNLNTHKMVQAHGFEFVPDYDRAERISDSASGEIGLGYSLSGEMNTQTGVIQAQGIIPTRVELSMGAMKGLEVPLINEEGIQKFLQKQGLSVEGNLLMIALNSNIVDTEIDSNFGAKFIFDKNFKPLQQMEGASFVLYAGVKTGNVLVKYLLSNKENAQKIVFVGDGEMYFEDPSFTASSRETFTFTTRSLLGMKKKELAIDGGLISFFNTNTTAKKKALNAYELKVPTLVTGMRKYIEFKHLKDSIFVGTSEEKEIEIPGNDFISKVLEMNQVSSLKERCVVQLNLSKDLRLMTANGKNRAGEMFVETTYLDKDGNFSRDNSELAEKAFIVGDMEGQIGVKLDYTDGSSEFLKTFCSEGTYLVEQL